jgi:hypothetical protein
VIRSIVELSVATSIAFDGFADLDHRTLATYVDVINRAQRS